MTRNVRRSSHLIAIACLATVLVSSPQNAEAKGKPFKIVGIGVAPQALPLPGQLARPHWIVGHATHLGRHYGEGSVQTTTIDVFDLEAGRIAGKFGSGEPFVFVGANGDELACDYGRDGDDFTGDYELTILEVLEDGNLVVEAFFIADFVPRPDDSTGKFAGVTGSWTMFAWTEPFVLGSTEPLLYGWVGSGRLNFEKNKK